METIGAWDLLHALEVVLVGILSTMMLHAFRESRRRKKREEEALARDPGEGVPAILSIGTENPPYAYTNEYYVEKLGLHLRGKGVVSDAWIDFFLPRCKNSGIANRYCVHPYEDFTDENLSKPHSERIGVFPSASKEYNPTAEERHEVWSTWAPKLGTAAASKALKAWGGNKLDITHLIFHSCTGFKAPGVELDIADALGLKNVKRRFGINYMGCFGAFTGLSIAKDIVQADPGAIVLLVCVEICSLHFSLSQNRSEFIGNTVFADGAAAALIGAGKVGNWALGSNRSHVLGRNTRHHMTWKPSNHGYCMFLDKSISQSLGLCLYLNIKKFMRSVCHVECTEDVEWCVHPGGIKILDVFCDPKFGLRLNRDILRHSYGVLRDYGNMSSPTILFVIESMMKDARKDRAFCLGFGPGLTIELLGLHRIGSTTGQPSCPLQENDAFLHLADDTLVQTQSFPEE